MRAMRALTSTRRRPGDRARRTGPGVAHGVPAGLMAPAVAALAFLVFPLAALLIRAPWRPLVAGLTEPHVLQTLRLSLLTSALAVGLCLPLGVPLAFALARVAFRGRRVVRALVTVPVVLPPVAGGAAVLLAPFGPAGPGPQGTPVPLPLTTTAVVLAEAFVALPFLVIGVEGALRAADPRLEETAATLGGSRWTVLRRVTLPLIAPGIAAGAVLCWARALGEFGATLSLAGHPLWRTPATPPTGPPVLDGGPATATALGMALVAVSVTVLACLRDRWVGTA